jgi:2',3'-cyclic-nucleotide 2'-phosphodiesterase (5'-nucleotidase family)
MVVVEAADSPSGKPLLIVSSEVSNTMTVFEIGQPTDFKLQLLHLADAEAGLLASSTAPNLAALVDGFDGAYPNTLILAGGDNFIPGPFIAGGTDISVRDELNTVTGSTMSTLSSFNHPTAAVDIAIHNIIGVEASTVGNHEFDLGTRVFRDSILSGSGWVGATFPYLSANLDFAGDSDIVARFTNTLSGNSTSLIPEANTLKGSIAPAVVITKGGEKIGLVGVTTQILESISSTGGVEVKGFEGDGLETNDMALLASQIQPAIDELKSEGVDKIILMAHLQQITYEQQLAPLLNGVDIILAAGSNTRLGDSNDVPALFTGHTADFAANYPIYTAGSDGLPTVIVNTDNEFTYLGRLVADFDSDGVLIVPNLTANIAENGAYAATDANVAAAWNTTVGNLATTAFAANTKGTKVKLLTDAVQAIINAKDGDVRGYTDVYLEGERNIIRNQQTNLGDIAADSMISAARTALPNATHIAGFKNGGGIRSSIGAVDVVSGAKTPPIANSGASKPANAVSLLDIENSLRFNNSLMVCDTTPAGLKAILEHGVFSLGTQGRFPQIGGIRFSYDPTATAGSRVQSIVLVDENDNITGRVVSAGAVRSDAPALITLVTMNFLAQGGDFYPFKANADNFRFLLTDGSLSAAQLETSDFTAAGVVPSNILGEQLALSNYLQAHYASAATAYDIAETTPDLDTRIQSTAVRTDNVLTGPATFAAWLALNGYSSTGINNDSDLDGSTDLVEYFFNQNTNSGSDNGNLPVVTMASGEKFLTFTTNNTAAGVNGILQTSTDLGISDQWDTAVQGVDYQAVSSVVSGAETTTTIKLLGTAQSKFWRHRITSN